MAEPLSKEQIQAQRDLKIGTENPYHGKPPIDDAERIACGILRDLCDRGGIKHALADVDDEICVDIVQAHAAIVRAGLAKAGASDKGESANRQVLGERLTELITEHENPDWFNAAEIDRFIDILAPLFAAVPVDMILHCPKCHMQHIDVADSGPTAEDSTGAVASAWFGTSAPRAVNAVFGERWDNPPHRSHLCRKEDGGCGTVWRPADVPTNGVMSILTRGKKDSVL